MTIQEAFALAVANHKAGRLAEAEQLYRQVLVERPDHADSLNLLGVIFSGSGRREMAVDLIRKAVTLEPDRASFHCNLGNSLKYLGQLDEAITAYRTAIRLKPRFAEAHNNLANALEDAGDWEQAIAAFRTAVQLDPHFAEAHSNLIFSLHHHPGYDASAIAEEERRWNQQHAEPLKHLLGPHGNDRSPGRRLRVGYVSPDFRHHPAGWFMLPLLEHHDRAAVEIFCYANAFRNDDMTEQLRRRADHWRMVRGLTDQQVADMIRQDRIDILVDLTMHASGGRLLVFARKPAPVQVTWLAYPGSTGLTAIDYRLTDPQLDPPGFNDGLYSEKSVRLPQTFWCYRSPIDVTRTNELPALTTGWITFGCLNNFGKVNEMMLSAWCRLLSDVPNSRLLLHSKEGSHRQKVRERLARDGIDPARLEFIGRMTLSEYFRCYHRVDIALDTFPYCGGTTTCDALWMGVPVVSLVGKTTVSRGGLTILTNVGLPELVASAIEEYMTIAKSLASDLPRLASLRGQLRQRMQKSPLMDAPLFAQNVEAAYRDMWRGWCDAQRQ